MGLFLACLSASTKATANHLRAWESRSGRRAKEKGSRLGTRRIFNYYRLQGPPSETTKTVGRLSSTTLIHKRKPKLHSWRKGTSPTNGAAVSCKKYRAVRVSLRAKTHVVVLHRAKRMKGEGDLMRPQF